VFGASGVSPWAPSLTINAYEEAGRRPALARRWRLPGGRKPAAATAPRGRVAQAAAARGAGSHDHTPGMPLNIGPKPAGHSGADSTVTGLFSGLPASRYP